MAEGGDFEMDDFPGRTSDPVTDDIEDTSFTSQILTDAVDSYYAGLREGNPTLGKDYSKFELADDGRLRLKAHPDLDLFHRRTREPLALSTISRTRDGASIVRNELGFVDWKRGKTRISKSAVETADRALEEASDGDHSSIARIYYSLEDIEAALRDEPFTLRELRRLDKAMQTTRGELVNNLAKLSKFDEEIDEQQRRLDWTLDPDTRVSIARNIDELNDERAARLEAASTNKETLRSQINRIRETLRRMLQEDTTLGERLRTLFREQGVTVVSIITALGMTISTLVLAITGGDGGGGGTGGTSPPTDKGGIREWVKKTWALYSQN